ncbi:MAG: methyltransferase domain-containing protein [Candidatus Nanopelagicaceae bacterium]|nr:methyltransferase domain-containing protein [Candidatus Nanopelagicaceae bacterium]
MSKDQNRDERVISHFGGEWKAFNYLDPGQLEELREQFSAYIRALPEEVKGRTDMSIGDFGAGSGRWAHFFLEFAKELWLVEPGIESFALLQERFVKNEKVHILNQGVSENSVPEESLDLAVSLGVLHHIPDTMRGVKDIYKKMKPGGYFLCYLYYALDDKPSYYRMIWRASNRLRFMISKLSYIPRRLVCEAIALLIYFPFARLSKVLKKVGVDPHNVPLHHYQDMTYYVMRNDAFDRFGTSLEQRFTKTQITEMVGGAGFDLSTLHFSDAEPFWTFSVRKPLLSSPQ